MVRLRKTKTKNIRSRSLFILYKFSRSASYILHERLKKLIFVKIKRSQQYVEYIAVYSIQRLDTFTDKFVSTI